MIDPTRIKPEMPVVCSMNSHFGTVDRTEGGHAIKLAKDANGQHHYIPLRWVSLVDDKVHLDRAWEDAVRGWSTNLPRRHEIGR